MTDGSKRPVTPLWQRPDWIERLVRRLAANTDNIDFSLHAFQREELRGISTVDAIGILRTGFVASKIVQGQNPGEWVCKVVKNLTPGKPGIGVVTVIINQQRLLVVTLEWEYPK